MNNSKEILETLTTNAVGDTVVTKRLNLGNKKIMNFGDKKFFDSIMANNDDDDDENKKEKKNEVLNSINNKITWLRNKHKGLKYRKNRTRYIENDNIDKLTINAPARNIQQPGERMARNIKNDTYNNIGFDEPDEIGFDDPDEIVNKKRKDNNVIKRLNKQNSQRERLTRFNNN